MGRYVSGDWEWKFAFADQNSTFGQVMETICSDEEENYVNRYVGTEGQGEQVELNVVNPESFVKACQNFIGSEFEEKSTDDWSKCNIKFGSDYWDKLMIKKFLKDMDFNQEETYSFYVEY